MIGRLACLVLILLSAASAQRNLATPFGALVKVRVSFADTEACESSTRVALVGSAGFTLSENSLDTRCEAEFFDVPAGNYRIQVTGVNVARAETEFTVNAGMSQAVEVTARHTGRSDEMQAHTASAFVSVKELGVPSAAEKEFNKASRLISKQDWAKAAERLQKAIAIYPQYASACNNLGSVYARMGDIPQARAFLQKAVALNDHLAPAYVNLARVSFSQKDFAGVEGFIQKALSLAAPDAGELTLLAFAQLAGGRLDQVVATTRQAHGLQPARHAFVHLLAARADELKGKAADYQAELQQFLKEEPTGQRAELVRSILAKYQAQGTGPVSAGP